MEWKKVKWLIIVLLLAVNIFLAANIAIHYIKTVRHEREALKAAIALTKSELGFREDIFVSLPRYLYSYSGNRDVAMEEKLVNSLMEGKASLSETGGGVYIYIGNSGENLTFRRGGAFSGTALKTEAGEYEKSFRKALNGSSVSAIKSEDKYSFSYRGQLIVNADFSVRKNGEHSLISGRIPLCSQWQREEKSCSRGEMVLALFSAIEKEDMGKLQSVSAVYFSSANGGMGLQLIPSWKAECEKGSITVSALDKSVLASEKSAD